MVAQANQRTHRKMHTRFTTNISGNSNDASKMSDSTSNDAWTCAIIKTLLEHIGVNTTHCTDCQHVQRQSLLKAERETKLQVEQHAKLTAEQEIKLKAEQEAKLRAERKAKLKAGKETKLKLDQEAKLKAEQNKRSS